MMASLEEGWLLSAVSLSGRAPQPPLNQISLYVKSYPLSFLFLSTQGDEELFGES